jgi:hypothetical protein
MKCRTAYKARTVFFVPLRIIFMCLLENVLQVRLKNSAQKKFESHKYFTNSARYIYIYIYIYIGMQVDVNVKCS